MKQHALDLVRLSAIGWLTVLAAGGAACQDTSAATGEPAPGADGGGVDGKFTPAGCEFSVTTRSEYASWAVDGPASGAGTANIRRVRLGLGGNVKKGPGYADPSTSIAIAWQTDDGAFGTEVRWGTTADPASWPAANKATGITWLTPQGQLAPNGDERMHETYICGLAPSTTYYYQVLAGEEKSDVYAFTTTPGAGEDVRIAITGDSRGEHNNAWQILERRLLELGVTAQMFSGDMVDLASSQAQWESWIDDAWKDENGKPSALGQLLMLATHGNHENHTPLYFGNVVLPQSPDLYPDYPEYFFSVDMGPLHIVAVDDFPIVSPTIDQNYAPVLKKWLEEDLAEANQNRDKHPWVIVMHHHPSYSSSLHGKDADVLRGRDFFAPIWDKYKVDMVFAGHDHDYERSHPLAAGSDVDSPQVVNQGGTVYVVCAGSGADGYGASSTAVTAYSASFDSSSHFGIYGILEASMTQLFWTPYWIDADADTIAEPGTTLQR